MAQVSALYTFSFPKIRTRAMSPRELKRFVMHYERLSLHALRTLPALADVAGKSFTGHDTNESLR